MNYIDSVESILFFVSATQQLYLMHRLIAGEHLAKLFFTMDRVHYKHPWPNTYRTCTRLEIAIQTLQASNMSVTTNAIPFLSIGADHACEHLNKLMKVHSGLMGFSNNANARLHFFMAAHELSGLSNDFNNQFGIETCEPRQHHGLAGNVVRSENSTVDKNKATITQHCCRR